jgi:hypothetical protein
VRQLEALVAREGCPVITLNTVQDRMARLLVENQESTVVEKV